MKKIAVLFTVFLGLIGSSYSATQIVDGITWTYTVGSGVACVGDDSSAAISTATVGTITVPTLLGGCPVTRIGTNAISGCCGLTSVKIPIGITSIGAGAFSGCTSLKSVSLSKSVKTIGDSSFRGCSYLEAIDLDSENESFRMVGNLLCTSDNKVVTGIGSSIVIPSGIEEVLPFAFSGRAGILAVNLPQTLKSIGEGAFENCGRISSIQLPISLNNVGSGAFAGCVGLLEVRVLSVSSMPGDLFYGCDNIEVATLPGSLCGIRNVQLKELTVTPGIVKIESTAFSGCTCLRRVDLPDGLEQIGSMAFANCALLESFVIPASVKSIGDDVLLNCNQLTSVSYMGDCDPSQMCWPLLYYTNQTFISGSILGPYLSTPYSDDTEEVRKTSKLAFGIASFAPTHLPDSVTFKKIQTVNKQITSSEYVMYGDRKVLRYNYWVSRTVADYSPVIGISDKCSISISPNERVYSGSRCTIELEACDQAIQLCYTTDGTDPNNNSTLYTGRFPIRGKTIVKAVGYYNGGRCTDIVKAQYGEGKVDKPEFSLLHMEKFYAAHQCVAISCSTPGAKIYYTLDGSAPTEQSLVYDGPFYIDATTRVRAIGSVDDLYVDSEIADAIFVREYKAVKAPKIISDRYEFYDRNGVVVEIVSEDSGVEIYYTTDGSTPDRSSERYEKSFTVDKSCTVKAIAYYEDCPPSSVASIAYVRKFYKVETPTMMSSMGISFSGAEGTMLTLFTITPDAVVKYTIDGSDPQINGIEFTSPVWVPVEAGGDVRVRAIAVCDDWEDSAETDVFISRVWELADGAGWTGQPFVTGGDSAWTQGDDLSMLRAGRISDSQDSYLETTVSCSGVFKFDWKCVCTHDVFDEFYYDRGEFLVDGIVVAQCDGVIDWTTVEYRLEGEGAHVIRWNFHKDESESVADEGLWLRNVSFLPDGESVSVNYDLNGATGQIEGKNVSKGKAIGALPQVQRAGYDFVGWFTAPSDGTQVGAGTVVNEDTTLYAHWDWIPENGTVSAIDVGGARDLNVSANWISQFLTGKYGADKKEHFRQKFGDNLSAALVQSTTKANGAKMYVWEDYIAGTDPTDSNSVFAAKVRMEGGFPVIEWEPNLNENGEERVYTVFGKADLKDAWHSPTNGTDRFFKVSVAMREGNVITLSLGGGSCDADPLVVSPGDPIGTLPEPTRDGYLFDGWYTSEEGGDKVTAETIAVEGMTIYARWISATRASLMHRWSFNGDMSDSVGGVTAALKGTATLGTTTCSTLGGSSGSSYIDLGNDLLPTNGEPITVELWVKQDTSVYWARIFDFGSMPQEGVFTGSHAETYSDVRLCWNGFYAFGFPGTGVNSYTEGYLDNSLSTGVEYYIVAIYAPSNTGVWQSTYRVRNAATGALVAEKTVTVNNTSWDSSKIGAKDCVLGQALTTWDSCAKATYNEVRIWKCALTDAEQQSNLQSGPDALAL